MALVRNELQKHRVSVQVELNEQVPQRVLTMTTIGSELGQPPKETD
jgi:hypothetical protein